MEKSKQGGETPFDLSDLAGFQFGPAWARKGDGPRYNDTKQSGTYNNDRPRPQGRDRREGRNFSKDNRGERGDRRDNRSGGRDFKRNDRFDKRNGDRRGGRPERPQRELPQPTEGLRVELRPSNLILEIFTKKIHEQKRALPLLELAKLVMSAPERYDMVYMKSEDGPMMIHSKKGDQACWLTEAEAISHIWNAAWLCEFYTEEFIEVDAPKGSFSAVARCTMGNELIGPANWHGYQSALINLHKSKYSRMHIDTFRNKIEMVKDEEAIAEWVQQASRKTIWKPTRSGAEKITLEDRRSVEQDFHANHYAAAYETVDKVFINCATSRKLLSPGLAAHMSILSDKSRRFPQMVIPNLCHGMARHHMPIYKWQGNHYTGPSRIRTIPTDMILADRMNTIVEWAKANSGKKLDVMFAEISGVKAGEDEASIAAATEAHAPFVTDMIWLLEQGFLVVTNDNSIWYPKGEAAPASPKLNKPKRSGAPAAKKPAPAKAKAEAKPAPAAEAEAAPTPTPEPTPAEEAPAPAAAEEAAAPVASEEAPVEAPAKKKAAAKKPAAKKPAAKKTVKKADKDADKEEKKEKKTVKKTTKKSPKAVATPEEVAPEAPATEEAPATPEEAPAPTEA